MKYKIIFGIIIPVAIIISLAIIASYGSITEEKDFLDSISLSEISNEGDLKDYVRIGEIKLTNDYSLTKKHNLPALGACLIDSQGFKQKLDAGNIEYSEGDYTFQKEIVISSQNNRGYRSVEVGSKKEKTISVYLRPSYQFSKKTNSELVEQYKDYDEIIIYEIEKSNRYSYMRTSCGSLNQKQVDDSIHITLSA
jgi:hypothetical protein